MHATPQVKRVALFRLRTTKVRSIPGSLLDAIPQEQHVNHERTSWGRLASIPVSTSARRRRYQLNCSTCGEEKIHPHTNDTVPEFEQASLSRT